MFLCVSIRLVTSPPRYSVSLGVVRGPLRKMIMLCLGNKEYHEEDAV